MNNKKILVIIIGLLVVFVAFGALAALNYYIYNEKQGTDQITEPAIDLPTEPTAPAPTNPNPSNPNPQNPPNPTQPEPTLGACYIGGCSSQVCSDDPDVITNCMYLEEYACYQTATCERQTDGQCGWTETAELNTCLNK